MSTGCPSRPLAQGGHVLLLDACSLLPVGSGFAPTAFLASSWASRSSITTRTLVRSRACRNLGSCRDYGSRGARCGGRAPCRKAGFDALWRPWSSTHGSGSFAHLEPFGPDAIDPEHPFADATVVFTGTLQSMRRADAAQAVVDRGGRVTSAVSKKQDYLVMGDQEYWKFADGQQSNKTRRAKELVADGHSLEVIGEYDFLTMLD